MKYKRIKLKMYILITVLLILFLLIFRIKIYINSTNKLFNKYSFNKINQKFDNIIMKSFNNNNFVYNENFYKIYYNDNNEIVYFDQDINITNYYINQISNNIKTKIKENNIIINVPYNLKQNIVFYNLIPKITIRVNNINSLIAYTSTNIKDYRINNAIIQTYINIEINYMIEGALTRKDNKYTYKYLINSKIITGKIPTIYGKEYSSTSKIFDIPIE